ncbi:transposase [Actinobacillus ureae]|uniref:helix-turn-helix domain-containing protein n=1 Tax=Actinobacillus ureae TaxID=723 RepID=UPI000E14F0CC|nr:transposase [Actinobacillus ureae]SUU47736.1 transposase [Actinobacillus ureae]
MTKYNSLFKQQVIEFYLQHDKNRLFTQRHFQLSKKTLTRWITQFNHNGINGLAVMGKKQKYSPEFKFLHSDPRLAIPDGRLSRHAKKTSY